MKAVVQVAVAREVNWPLWSLLSDVSHRISWIL